MRATLLIAFWIITVFGMCDAITPDLLVDPNLNVDDSFTRYFILGASYACIKLLLATFHGVHFSIGTLKKKRKRLGLNARRGPTANTEIEIRNAIIELLPSMPWTAGYRNIFYTLKHLGYDIRRDTVMNILKEVDPGGVNLRRRRRLKRRRYLSPGPNFNWHVDGYDKLKPYGFAIHGAVDGYSRRIMWLEVNPSNNNPVFVASHFMQCVHQVKGCPTLLSTDPGTENGIMAALQCTFRQHHQDEFRAINSHRYVKSTSNQRIEAWWCLFRRDRMEWWIDFLTNLAASPHFNKDNNIHIFSIRYCFMPVLKVELYEIATRWNNHYNTGNPLGRCPRGRPNILYSLGTSYLHELSDAVIQFGFEQCEVQTRSGNSDFDEYASNIFQRFQWEDATNRETALTQYVRLKDVADQDV